METNCNNTVSSNVNVNCNSNEVVTSTIKISFDFEKKIANVEMQQSACNADQYRELLMANNEYVERGVNLLRNTVKGIISDLDNSMPHIQNISDQVNDIKKKRSIKLVMECMPGKDPESKEFPEVK